MLCLALNKKAAKWATKAFMGRRVTKLYLALVRGHVIANDDEMTIEVAIGRDKRFDDVHRMCTIDSGSHCDEPVTAKTSLFVLEHGLYDGEPASKVVLVPHTGKFAECFGYQNWLNVIHVCVLHVLLIILLSCCVVGRTHQLRVHCRYAGHPIVGDISYNADSKPYRMMLHAHVLCIPMMHEKIDVIALDPFTHDIDSLWCPKDVFRTVDDVVMQNRLSALNL